MSNYDEDSDWNKWYHRVRRWFQLFASFVLTVIFIYFLATAQTM